MKILLVSSCSNIAIAYAALLRGYDGVESVDAVSTLSELISVMNEKPIDVIAGSAEILDVMDVAVPILEGTELHRPKSVLVLEHVSGKVVVDAIKNGFNDVIDLNQTAEEIVARLRNVVSGEIDLATHTYVDGVRNMLNEEDKCRLANDETDVQILLELARGHSNKEIAEAVFLSLQTVRNRVSRLMQVTEAHNRTELALMFIQG